MFSSILLPFTALLAATSSLARITNITFPSTAYLGQTIKVNVTETAYIQNWDDLGVLFGFQAPQYKCGKCLGQGEWWVNLYGSGKYAGTNGTRLANYTIDVPVAPYLNSSQDFLIVAAVPYVAGASGVTGFRYFNSSIVLTPNPS